MKTKRGSVLFFVSLFFLTLFIGGCVTHARFDRQVAETQTLSDQLNEEIIKRGDVEREVAALENRLKGLNAKLDSLTTSSKEKTQEMRNKITDLKKEIRIANELKEKIERELKADMQSQEGIYKAALQKTRGAIAALESVLAEHVQEIAHLRNTLSEQIQDTSHLEDVLQRRDNDVARLQQALKGSVATNKKIIADLQSRLSGREHHIDQLKNQLRSSQRESDQLDEALKVSEKKNKAMMVTHLDVLSNRDREIAQLKKSLQLREKDAVRMERQLRESEKAHKDLVSNLRKEIKDGNVKITRLKNRLSVKIVDKILFASGSDHITTDGQGVLKKVSEVLKDVTENEIRIEGHTDNVPIGPKIIDRFASNWELSTARATQVARFLFSQEVQPKNMVAAGYSEFRPVASNETPEGKQRNRRIQIVLFPRDISKIIEEVN